MPWKTQTMKETRKLFVQRALAKGANLSALCREFNITRRTGRKWRERAREGGLDCVKDRSRRPLHSPNRLQEEEVCHLIMLKNAWPSWGPKKLCQLYEETTGRGLSRSTCHRVLESCGLVEERKVRVRRPVQHSVAAHVAKEPNDVWTIDFKGWWPLQNGQRCEPFTVRDAFSRFILCAYVPTSTGAAVIQRQMNELFRRYGLPKVIKSDNGSPFACTRTPLGLTRLSAGWVALGIELEHSRPAHPQDNGAHERMHRDIEMEVAAHVQVDTASQQAALDVWSDEFNRIRPHEHLNNKRPAQLYHPSPRSMPKGKWSLEYGPGFLPRLVSTAGVIRYRGAVIFITTALTGWHVGLRLQDSASAEVWFNHLLIGKINLNTRRFDSAPSRSVKAPGVAA
jgi:putative transposase